VRKLRFIPVVMTIAALAVVVPGPLDHFPLGPSLRDGKPTAS
jgi:hypothetical protein